LLEYSLTKLSKVNANLKNSSVHNRIAADLGYTAETSVSKATPAMVAELV